MLMEIGNSPILEAMPRMGFRQDLRVAVSFLRSLRGWNQRELAEAAGVDKALISLYEQGKKMPSKRTLERLVAAVGLPFSLFEDTLPFIRLVRSALEGGPQDEEGAAEASTIARSVSDAVHAAVAQALAGLSRLSEPADEPGAASARVQAEEQWLRLSRHPVRDQRVLVEGAREFQTWALAERLCAESETAAAGDPGRALELAELALRVADLAPGGESWRSRLQGYAWAHVGYARRIAGDLAGAADAFAQARTLWAAGDPGDQGLLDEERLLELTGSLP
jgi:transcriptional regulator with XRE-family HTH domain